MLIAAINVAAERLAQLRLHFLQLLIFIRFSLPMLFVFDRIFVCFRRQTGF